MSRYVISLAIVVVTLSVLAGGAWSNSRTDDPLGIAVSPQNLVLSINQGSVSVHTDISYHSVNLCTVRLDDIVPAYMKSDLRGNLVAKFYEEDVEAIVSPPSATLTLTGEYISGEGFSGSDSVQVRP